MGKKFFENEDPFKKPYRRSLLRKLSLKKQTEVVARIDDGSDYMKVAGELTKEGIPTSGQMLSNFRQWFMLRDKLWSDAEFALELVRICKKNGWIKSAREERAAAQLFFNRAVLADKDPKMWSMVEKTSLARDKQALEEEKLALMREQLQEKNGKNKKDGTGAAPISDEEKEAAIRQIYGMSS